MKRFLCCNCKKTNNNFQLIELQFKRLRISFSSFRWLKESKGVRKGGFGVKTPLELDFLQKLYYLRKGD